jgi:hypothetical protein
LVYEVSDKSKATLAGEQRFLSILQTRILEENSEVGLVYTNGQAIDENGKILYQLLPEGFKEKIFQGKYCWIVI